MRASAPSKASFRHQWLHCRYPGAVHRGVCFYDLQRSRKAFALSGGLVAMAAACRHIRADGAARLPSHRAAEARCGAPQSAQAHWSSVSCRVASEARSNPYCLCNRGARFSCSCSTFEGKSSEKT
eukprot:scaffold186877_cov32-Tisochrysis_lutea.AAC.2